MFINKTCIEYNINGSIHRTEPLCSPWDIERRLQSLLSTYGFSWFKSNVKLITFLSYL